MKKNIKAIKVSADIINTKRSSNWQVRERAAHVERTDMQKDMKTEKRKKKCAKHIFKLRIECFRMLSNEVYDHARVYKRANHNSDNN